MRWPVLFALVSLAGAVLPSDSAPKCSGLTVITDTGATISDGIGTYPSGGDCGWLFQPTDPQPVLYFQMRFIEIEDYDTWVFVYENYTDYDNPGNLLAQYKGVDRFVDYQYDPQSETGAAIGNLSTTTGSLYVHFLALPPYVMWGFVGAFFTDDNTTALLVCPEDCRGHGTCDTSTGVCTCDDGYSNTNCANDDVYAFTQMFYHVNSSILAQTNWITEPDICLWQGLECYTCRIWKVVLPYMGLTRMPQFYPYLVEYIDYDHNDIEDTIPDLSAGIAVSGGYSYIDLSYNKIYGTLPTNLGSFTSLRFFDVTSNQLTGSIWSQIWRNPQLTHTYLADNQLTGFIPDSFEFLPVGTIDINNNLFWCPLPAYASMLTSTCTLLQLDDAQPARAVMRGFTLTLTGVGFLTQTDLRCYVGTDTYMPTVLTETRIECEIPKAIPGELEVAISDGDRIVSTVAKIFVEVSCPIGTFARFSSSTECEVCPLGGQCPGDLSPPLTLPGYALSTTQAFSFIKCPFEAACLPGSPTTLCAAPHAGPLCAGCQDGYYHLRTECIQCNERTFYALRAVLIVFPLVILCLVLYQATRLFKLSSTAILFRFVQTASLIVSFPLPWPSDFFSVFSFLAVIDFDIDILSPACSFNVTFFDGWIMVLVFPILVAALVALFGVLGFFYYRLKKKPYTVAQVRDQCVDAYLLFLTLAHSPLSRIPYQYFNCQVTTDGAYLRSAPYIQCGTGEHAAFRGWAISALVIYTFGIPLTFSLILYHSRHALADPNVRRRYGSLYRIYFYSFWFFEPMYRLRNVCLLFLPLLTSADTTGGAVIGSAVLALFLAISIYSMPFGYYRNNKVMILSEVALVVLLFCGISYKSSSISTTTGVSIVLAILVCVTMLFIIHAILHETVHYSGLAWMRRRPCMGKVLQTSCARLTFDTDHLANNARSYAKEGRANPENPYSDAGRMSVSGLPLRKIVPDDADSPKSYRRRDFTRPSLASPEDIPEPYSPPVILLDSMPGMDTVVEEVPGTYPGESNEDTPPPTRYPSTLGLNTQTSSVTAS